MSAESHIKALLSKHAELDKTLAKEELRPLPDPTLVSEIKQKKLSIKDEISRLSKDEN